MKLLFRYCIFTIYNADRTSATTTLGRYKVLTTDLIGNYRIVFNAIGYNRIVNGIFIGLPVSE